MPGTWYPNAEEHPPSPLQRGKSGAKRGCYPFKGGRAEAKRWGKRHRISAEGCKPDATFVVHSHVHYYINGKRRTVYRVIWV